MTAGLRRIRLSDKAIDTSLVYGEPYETDDGTTIITVARPGGLFRPVARPAGIFVIREGKTRWVPAADSHRLGLIAIVGGLLPAIIAAVAVLRRPPWPDLPRG
ncbi:hypothetical protein [Nocardia arthritidis]|uniref:Sporulation protein n=1 Tax=Nocardia arthritidis TaxID=228602 RepID=A0A6G9YB10_9NOCA|nr:hypothetical protein [Nocardia arthritidis]QIS10334.1 hypothetical protein F5544_12215 [Nocardia arthritidis]